MVHRQADRRAAIARKSGGAAIFFTILCILVISFGAVIGILVAGLQKADEVAIDEQVDVVEPVESVEEVEKIAAIDFQPIIDELVGQAGGRSSVLIYDLELDKVAGSYNLDEDYNTASLYKLFVVYEGYRRVNAGDWDPNTLVGSTGKSIAECLDLAIRESNSSCAEPLWAMIGHDALDEIIVSDFGIKNSDISGLVSNPTDIAEIMKLFYYHPDIDKDDLISTMKDSFLVQPTTEYNWRQGLPSGFKVANVYNKVGWDYNPSGKYWNVYNDAAIVEFEEQDRHFIVVVMTNKVPYQQITKLGTEIENTFLESTKEL